MREILFRGKALKTSEWVFGFVQKKQVIGGVNWLIHEDLRASTAYHAPIVINPSTIGQYTGLTDKNGTKIFEGDICKFESYIEEFTNYEILWRVNMWVALAWEENIADVLDLFFCERSIIIGNIHDNPELLEE